MVNNKRILINSAIFALYVVANAICTVINIGGSFALVTLLIMVLYVYNRNTLHIRKISIVVIPCLFWFFLSFLLLGYHDILMEHILYFCFMGICGLYISQIEIDVFRVFLYIAILSLFIAPVLLIKVPVAKYSDDVGLVMGISYSLVRLLTAIVFLLYFLRNTRRCFFKLGYFLYFLILFVLTLTFCSRGAILALFLSVFLCFFISPTKYKKIKIFFVLIILLSVSTNFLNIIEALFNYLSSIGLEVGGLWKILNLAKEGDISNGREDLYSIGWKMFCDSPIIGNGIASFPIRTGVVYVHNIFVQFLLEGGLLFFIPFLAVLIIFIKLLFRTNVSWEKKMMLIYLFSCGVFPLFFSETFWRVQVFWLFIGYVLKIRREPKILCKRLY